MAKFATFVYRPHNDHSTESQIKVRATCKRNANNMVIQLGHRVDIFHPSHPTNKRTLYIFVKKIGTTNHGNVSSRKTPKKVDSERTRWYHW